MKKNVKLLACLIAIAMIVSLTSVSSFASWGYDYIADRDEGLPGWTCQSGVSGDSYYNIYEASSGVIGAGGSGTITLYADIGIFYTDNTSDGTFNGYTYNLSPYATQILSVQLSANTSKVIQSIQTGHIYDDGYYTYNYGFILYAGIDF